MPTDNSPKTYEVEAIEVPVIPEGYSKVITVTSREELNKPEYADLPEGSIAIIETKPAV